MNVHHPDHCILRLCMMAILFWLVSGADRSTQGDVIDVQNAGFEDISGSFEFNEFTFGPPIGWEIHDPNNLVANNGVGPSFWVGTLRPSPPTFFSSVAPEGERVAILFNVAGTGNAGEYGLVQTLADTLQGNSRYRLQVEVGNIASGTAESGEFFDLDGFPGYRIDLMAGGSVLASDDNSLAGSIPEGEWGTSLLQFETGNDHPLLGQSLAIRLVNLNRVDPDFPGADLEVDFDHVRLSITTIPEPATASLLLGLGGLLWLPRRRHSYVKKGNSE